MNTFETLRQAKAFAAEKHRGQTLKGHEVPYMVHLIRVDSLLASVGADIDERIAGWLHDVMEDQGVALPDISVRFGVRVARIVEDLTQPDNSYSWEVRKRYAEDRVANWAHDTQKVQAADTIANLEIITADYRKNEEAVFSHFNAPKEPWILHKQHMVARLQTSWPENPLMPKLLNTYEDFIFAVGKSGN